MEELRPIIKRFDRVGDHLSKPVLLRNVTEQKIYLKYHMNLDREWS